MTLSAPYRSTRHRKASDAGSQTDSSESDRAEDCPLAHLKRRLVLTPGAAMPGVGCMIINSRKTGWRVCLLTKRYASFAMAVSLSPSGCRTNAVGAWLTAYKDMLRNTRCSSHGSHEGSAVSVPRMHVRHNSDMYSVRPLLQLAAHQLHRNAR